MPSTTVTLLDLLPAFAVSDGNGSRDGILPARWNERSWFLIDRVQANNDARLLVKCTLAEVRSIVAPTVPRTLVGESRSLRAFTVARASRGMTPLPKQLPRRRITVMADDIRWELFVMAPHSVRYRCRLSDGTTHDVELPPWWPVRCDIRQFGDVRQLGWCPWYGASVGKYESAAVQGYTLELPRGTLLLGAKTRFQVPVHVDEYGTEYQWNVLNSKALRWTCYTMFRVGKDWQLTRHKLPFKVRVTTYGIFHVAVSVEIAGQTVNVPVENRDLLL